MPARYFFNKYDGSREERKERCIFGLEGLILLAEGVESGSECGEAG